MAALAELLQAKRLDDITVTQLVEKCGISRQAFYYHFSALGNNYIFPSDGLAYTAQWLFQCRFHTCNSGSCFRLTVHYIKINTVPLRICTDFLLKLHSQPSACLGHGF